MTLPQVGSAAPDFSTIDDRNRPVSLSEFRGQWIVLFFYPKDDTPG
jgi:thioredoxin-dependent peroxiredoxin